LVRQLPDHPTGITGCKYIRRNVAGYHAAGTDYATRANGDTWIDDGAAADPDVVLNPHRPGRFQPGSAYCCIQRMGGGIDLHCRANQHVVADLHLGTVQYHAIEVEEDGLAQVNVAAVVALEWRLDPDLAAAGTEQFSQQIAAFFQLLRPAVIECLEQFPRPPPLQYQLIVARVIELSPQHLVLFRRHKVSWLVM